MVKKGNIPWNKGKTGIIFTKEHKQNLSKSLKNNPKLLGNQYWKKRNHIKLREILRINNQKPEFKNKISNSIKKLWQNKEYKEHQIKVRLGKISHRKGLSQTEEYGKEKAKILKEKDRLNNIGKKYSNETNKKKGRSGDLNVSKRPEVRLKIRLKTLERIERQLNNNLPIMPHSSKNEIKILNILEQNFYPYVIKRQYKILGYFLDGYCPALNLAIEIDGSSHNNCKERDLQRENEIKSVLNCKFLRIKEMEVTNGFTKEKSSLA